MKASYLFSCSLEPCIQRGIYFFIFSPLPFASLLFSVICKASSDNHLPFFFLLGMVFIPDSCIMLQTSAHSFSGSLSIRCNPWIYLTLSLYRHNRFEFGHTWMALWFTLCVLVTQLCPTLCDPRSCSPPWFSVGFSRQEYWSGLPFLSPEDLLNPGIEPWSPALQADSLPFEL